MLINFLASTLNKVLSGIIMAALAFAAVQTVRLSWSQGTIERMKAAQDRAITEAVIRAVNAERHAQAEHEANERARHSHTQDLRKAAAKAPAGRKTRAVINAIAEQ